MTVAKVSVTDEGGLVATELTARHMLKANAGKFSLLQVGGLLLMTPDAGSGAGPREGEFVAMAGDVRAMPLLGLLNLLGQNRETGRLVVKRGALERVIMLRDGDIASVGSNAAEDRLGRFLVRLGKINEGQLHDALGEAGHTKKRLGQILVSRGWLDAHDLWATIQEQITEIFSEVVNWTEGAFVLYRTEGEYRFPSTPPLSMQGLLLEAVRRADEMSRFRDVIPDAAVPVQRTAKSMGPDHSDAHERAAYAALVEAVRIDDLARAIHLSEFETTRAIFGLMRQGLVEVGAKAEEEVAGPFHLSDEGRAKIDVFNLAFTEIRDEVVRNGKLEGFMVGVLKYMSDDAGAYRKVFRGIAPDPSGALPIARLETNLQTLDVESPIAHATEALNELTFFMLFQCGELLDSVSDENLGRRVRLIHSALSGSSVL